MANHFTLYENFETKESQIGEEILVFRRNSWINEHSIVGEEETKDDPDKNAKKVAIYDKKKEDFEEFRILMISVPC